MLSHINGTIAGKKVIEQKKKKWVFILSTNIV
jgi:hypothetical protein